MLTAKDIAVVFNFMQPLLPLHSALKNTWLNRPRNLKSYIQRQTYVHSVHMRQVRFTQSHSTWAPSKLSTSKQRVAFLQLMSSKPSTLTLKRQTESPLSSRTLLQMLLTPLETINMATGDKERRSTRHGFCILLDAVTFPNIPTMTTQV